MYNNFERDINTHGLMWVESVNREFGVLINVAVDPIGLQYLVNKGTVKALEKLIMALQYKGDEMEPVNRCLNLMSKLSKDPNGARQIAESRDLVLKTLLYFNRAFP